MRRPRPRRRPAGPITLGLGMLLGFTFCGGLSEVEVWCEEAVAHLQACCPGFDPGRYTCTGPSFPTGCDDSSFKADQSKALTKLSCQALVDGGFCVNPNLPTGQVTP